MLLSAKVVKVNDKLTEILKLISVKQDTICEDGQEIQIKTKNKKTLIKITSEDIVISGLFNLMGLFTKFSPLKDDFVDSLLIKNFINHLYSNNYIQRLNHLGFCYQAGSIRKEKERLIMEVKKTKWHLYEEKSFDGLAWLYIGDRTSWESPLIELVLYDENIYKNYKWNNYVFPHIQIDIDTCLMGEEIEKLIKVFFKGKIKPVRLLELNNFIISVRARLGVISGINFNLDLGFEGRMTRYHRNLLLKQLD